MVGPQTRKIWAVAIACQDYKLGDKAKLVFARLVDRFNVSKGSCYPSEALIARELNCTERTVRSAIRNLRAQGYIQVTRNGGPRGANLYVTWLPRGKSEYKAAERKCHETRKLVSAKPLKKTIKETKKSVGASSGQSTLCKNGEKSHLSIGKLRAELEQRFVSRYGFREDIWSKLADLEEAVWNEVAGKIQVGEVTLDEGVSDLLRAINESN